MSGQRQIPFVTRLIAFGLFTINLLQVNCQNFIREFPMGIDFGNDNDIDHEVLAIDIDLVQNFVFLGRRATQKSPGTTTYSHFLAYLIVDLTTDYYIGGTDYYSHKQAYASFFNHDSSPYKDFVYEDLLFDHSGNGVTIFNSKDPDESHLILRLNVEKFKFNQMLLMKRTGTQSNNPYYLSIQKFRGKERLIFMYYDDEYGNGEYGGVGFFDIESQNNNKISLQTYQVKLVSQDRSFKSSLFAIEGTDRDFLVFQWRSSSVFSFYKYQEESLFMSTNYDVYKISILWDSNNPSGSEVSAFHHDVPIYYSNLHDGIYGCYTAQQAAGLETYV